MSFWRTVKAIVGISNRKHFDDELFENQFLFDEKTDNKLEQNVEKWDRRFLALAAHVANWSKDPSTKTGAVIVDSNNRIVSLGYNGFPKGVYDFENSYNNRELKYKMIVHCERNAIIFAKRDLENCTLYTVPFQSCSICAAMVIQSGIKRCVAPTMPEHLKERWAEDMGLAAEMFKEAGVELKLYDNLPDYNKLTELLKSFG